MTEVIADPAFLQFGATTSSWKIRTHAGVQVSPSILDGVLSLDISNAKGANWHAELEYSPIEVHHRTEYAVCFQARARHPFTFSVWLGQRDSPYSSLVLEDNHFGEEMMTREWQTFRHTWRTVMEEPRGRLNFVVGQIDNLVEIRNVSLRERP